MNFKGFHKVSLIDYPGKICAMVFTGGCNFRCHYCHNPELVIGYEKLPDISEEEIISSIIKRKGLLDGLCISGGEPTICQGLLQFMEKIKKLGFLVKLDTNGTNPAVLKESIEKKLVDYIAMDIKGTSVRYPEIVGAMVDISKTEESVQILLQNKIDYEFRTTVFPEFISEKDAIEIGKWTKGAKRYVLQQPSTEKTLNKAFKPKKLYSDSELLYLSKFLSNPILR
jgi:pyruvate formate lyase activating enzyme